MSRFAESVSAYEQSAHAAGSVAIIKYLGASKMNLKECYDALGGNYAEVKDRLKKENMIAVFMKMFVQENFFEKLKDSINSGDVQAAFRAAHSLKGNCMSLGLAHLQKKTEEITEPLRNSLLDEAVILLDSLEKEYVRTTDIISALSFEDGNLNDKQG